MNSKEIIRRTIGFGKPERIGWHFNEPHESDMSFIWTPLKRAEWGFNPEIKNEVPEFQGQVMKDPFGNIWGRLDEVSKGEVIKGALQDGWERLPDFTMPVVEKMWIEPLKKQAETDKEKFIAGHLPGFPFSIMRTIRGMENFLMDIMLQPDEIMELGEKVISFLEESIDVFAGAGADGIMFCEDWGTQNALLISPKTWRDIFKPMFKRISRRVHEKNMYLMMHSCGYIYDIVEDLLETGVDALQLDQPALMGMERLSREFGGRVAFYSPVDIQKIMQTGSKELIQHEARKMIELFGKFKGGFIAKDYGSWEAIDVKEEWAQWARDIFTKEGYYV